MNRKTSLKVFLISLISFLTYWSFVEYLVIPKLFPIGKRAQIKRDYNYSQIPKDQLGYIIIGDSSALYSINPLSLNNNSYSAAELGSSVAESRKLLSKLNIKKINNGIILMQTFIPPHYDEDIWNISVTMKLMNLHDVLDIFCGELEKNCNLNMRAYYRFKYLWTHLHLNSHIFVTMGYAIKEKLWQDTKRYHDYLRSTIYENNGHFGVKSSKVLEDHEFYMPYHKYFKQSISPPPTELSELVELEKIAQSHNTKLIVVFPQFFQETKNIDLALYSKSYRDFIKKNVNSKIIFIGADDIKIDYKRRHFRDFNHLNQDGAIFFTKALSEYLEKL